MSPTIEPIVCPYDPTWVMAYYVDAPRPALVDTGGGRHPTDAIQPALAARGTTLAAIEVIINTHGHWDHAGGNAAVAVACSPEILVHAAGAPLLVDERPHLDGYLTDTARLLEQPALAAAQRATFPDFFQRGPAGTRLLGDGDRIDLGAGVMFDVLHAPGHSNDHVALFWEREGVLVAGDAAQGTGSRLGGCPSTSARPGRRGQASPDYATSPSGPSTSRIRSVARVPTSGSPPTTATPAAPFSRTACQPLTRWRKRCALRSMTTRRRRFRCSPERRPIT